MSDALKSALLERARREKQRRAGAAWSGGYGPQDADLFNADAPGGSVDVMRPVTSDPTGISGALETLADNVIGLDNDRMSPGEKAATALNTGGESLTLGLVGDEAAAAVDAAMGRGSYDDRLAVRRSQEAQLRQENPGVALAAEVAPAFIPGKMALSATQKLATLAGRGGAAAAMGAGAAGTYGFMEGEGGVKDRAENALITGAFGGIIGGATPRLTDALSSLPKRLRGVFKRSQSRPTINNLKAAKSAAYKAVDDSGEVFSGEEMSALYGRVKGVFDDLNYVEETDSASKAVLTILERRQGQPTTISQLDNVRKGLWKRYAAAKDQPRILDAIKSIDELIDGRSEASALMSAARAANSRYSKTQLLHDAFEKAQDQTSSTGSGGNILNKYRQAVTSIINNEKKSRFFSPGEIDMMRAFVRGTAGENAKRLVGKLSPSGNGLMMALHMYGSVATGGLSTPLMAVGAAAKASADRGALRGADAILDTVSGFVAPPSAPRLTGVQTGLISAGAPVAERASTALRQPRSRRQ